ncbi:MAG: hypothetical protein JST49_04345 [Bacteroidetes bacterium]|nr:hypothetical protein [Bacteroidota bacterium]
MDLIFVATDTIEFDVLLDEDKLIEKYMMDDNRGLESAYAKNEEDAIKTLQFVFGKNVALNDLVADNGKRAIDLSAYKGNVISFEELEEKYAAWIESTGIENNMDTYGHLIFIIGYAKRNIEKKYLYVVFQ